MSRGIVIREAVIQDVNAIIGHKKKVLTDYPEYMGTTIEEMNDTVTDELQWIKRHQNHTGFMLVALDEDGIIGMLSFRRSERPRYKHQGVFGMSIQKNYTNQGIGKEMLTTLIEWAKLEPVIEKISLEVFSDNERAIHLYKRLGFEVEGKKRRLAKNKNGDYVDDVMMSRFM